jgi:hypothetical protein
MAFGKIQGRLDTLIHPLLDRPVKVLVAVRVGLAIDTLYLDVVGIVRRRTVCERKGTERPAAQHTTRGILIVAPDARQRLLDTVRKAPCQARTILSC